MVSLQSILVMALLLTGLLLYVLLPTDFRTAFFKPATSGQRLLVRSLGLVAVLTLIVEIAIGHSPDNGINGISPCLLFGIYGSLVLYGRAAYFLWRWRSHQRDLPAGAGQVQ